MKRRLTLMNKLKNTNKKYAHMEVPDNLSEIIQQTVNETSPPRSTRHFFKLLVPLTLAMTTVFVILLNTSPVLASNLSHIPLLTQIVKVLTFRNYQTMDEMKNIYVRIPVLENTGNNELEDRINYEIKKQIDFSVSKSEQLAKELYDTYIQAGYKPSQIEPLLVEVDYQTTFYNDRYLSFIIKKYENIPYSTVDKEQYYYNVDLQTGGHITLPTVFGPDYLTKVGTEIYKQIESKKKEDENMLFFDEINIFEVLENEEKFYINEQGQVVISFDRYEIAPGYMGYPEFIINLPMEMNLNET